MSVGWLQQRRHGEVSCGGSVKLGLSICPAIIDSAVGGRCVTEIERANFLERRVQFGAQGEFESWPRCNVIDSAIGRPIVLLGIGRRDAEPPVAVRCAKPSQPQIVGCYRGRTSLWCVIPRPPLGWPVADDLTRLHLKHRSHAIISTVDDSPSPEGCDPRGAVDPTIRRAPARGAPWQSLAWLDSVVSCAAAMTAIGGLLLLLGLLLRIFVGHIADQLLDCGE